MGDAALRCDAGRIAHLKRDGLHNLRLLRRRAFSIRRKVASRACEPGRLRPLGLGSTVLVPPDTAVLIVADRPADTVTTDRNKRKMQRPA